MASGVRGPLVDLSGRVVGITSAIARSPGTFGGSGKMGTEIRRLLRHLGRVPQ